MEKILGIYHSQQYGNTKILAEALAEGAREAMAEVNLINVNERRVTLEEFLAAGAVAIGTPDYFSYVAGTTEGGNRDGKEIRMERVEDADPASQRPGFLRNRMSDLRARP